MFKLAMALLGSAAVLATPVAASAQHISSPNGSTLTLQGPASLGANQCLLTLVVALTEKGGHTSPPLYDSGTVTSGTNVPNPSPACVAISLVGGDFDLSNYGINGPGTAQVDVNNLVINAGGLCNTGPFTGYVANLGTTQIELDVPPGTATPCGPIGAAIVSTNPTPVQVVP